MMRRVDRLKKRARKVRSEIRKPQINSNLIKQSNPRAIELSNDTNIESSTALDST